jgi:hypothetical protein
MWSKCSYYCLQYLCGGYVVATDRSVSILALAMLTPSNCITFRLCRHCIKTALYLLEELSRVGISCRLNDLSSTVVLERPIDDAFVKRWQLACEEDIAHVVVMPNITRNKIDLFVEELVESIHKYGRIKPASQHSPLTVLESDSWM